VLRNELSTNINRKEVSMSVNIIGEDFSVTEAMNAQIQEKIEKMISHMKTPSNFDVFLKKTGTHEFEVIFKTHYRSEDFVGTGLDRDFYSALNKAKKSILRQIDDDHARRVQERRHA
jgi:ribosomal subunit interface protein